MEKITDNQLFGILISLAMYYGGAYIRMKFNKSWINPLLISIILIVVLLLVTGIPFDHYMKGGSVIHAFLGPVTVVLALPLYRQRTLLVQYKHAIIGGIIAGVASALISVVVLCRLLEMDSILERSILGHSVTTPIGIAVSNSLGAVEGITVLSVIITGLFGAAIAPLLFRLFKIVQPIAKGLALGTGSHAMGTTKAFEMGETEGAMSSLAIGLAAMTTVLTVAILQAFGWY